MRWSALALCAALAACAPPDLGPTPTGTLEPRITESSPQAPKPKPNDACKLLTAEEREDLMGMSMDAEVPVMPLGGTEECIWTHSLNEPARSAIRVTALNGAAWAQVARPQVVRAIGNPATRRDLADDLEDALVDLASPTELTDERTCEIYLMFSEAYGLTRTEELLFYGNIGAMPAVFAASCEGGRIVMAGFGEYGLRGSIAANHAAARLVDAAKSRAADVLSGTTPDEAADGEGAADGEDGDESPSPDPAQADEADTEADAEAEEDS